MDYAQRGSVYAVTAGEKELAEALEAEARETAAVLADPAGERDLDPAAVRAQVRAVLEAARHWLDQVREGGEQPKAEDTALIEELFLAPIPAVDTVLRRVQQALQASQELGDRRLEKAAQAVMGQAVCRKLLLQGQQEKFPSLAQTYAQTALGIAREGGWAQLEQEARHLLHRSMIVEWLNARQVADRDQRLARWQQDLASPVVGTLADDPVVGQTILTVLWLEGLPRTQGALRGAVVQGLGAYWRGEVRNVGAGDYDAADISWVLARRAYELRQVRRGGWLPADLQRVKDDTTRALEQGLLQISEQAGNLGPWRHEGRYLCFRTPELAEAYVAYYLSGGGDFGAVGAAAKLVREDRLLWAAPFTLAMEMRASQYSERAIAELAALLPQAQDSRALKEQAGDVAVAATTLGRIAWSASRTQKGKELARQLQAWLQENCPAPPTAFWEEVLADSRPALEAVLAAPASAA